MMHYCGMQQTILNKYCQNNQPTHTIYLNHYANCLIINLVTIFRSVKTLGINLVICHVASSYIMVHFFTIFKKAKVKVIMMHVALVCFSDIIACKTTK